MGENFALLVYKIVKKIPPGKVLTYGDVAFLAKSPRAARIVGALMAKAPPGQEIPCHRVLYKDGALCRGDAFGGAFGGAGIQRQLLEKEGVSFLKNGCVDLSKYRMKL